MRIKYIYIIFVSTKGNKNKKNMKTTETKYFIDYIYNNTSGLNFYHQLVRRADGAILYANQSIDNVFIRCWEMGIQQNEVIIL